MKHYFIAFFTNVRSAIVVDWKSSLVYRCLQRLQAHRVFLGIHQPNVTWFWILYFWGRFSRHARRVDQLLWGKTSVSCPDCSTSTHNTLEIITFHLWVPRDIMKSPAWYLSYSQWTCILAQSWFGRANGRIKRTPRMTNLFREQETNKASNQQ